MERLRILSSDKYRRYNDPKILRLLNVLFAQVIYGNMHDRFYIKIPYFMTMYYPEAQVTISMIMDGDLRENIQFNKVRYYGAYEITFKNEFASGNEDKITLLVPYENTRIDVEVLISGPLSNPYQIRTLLKCFLLAAIKELIQEQKSPFIIAQFIYLNNQIRAIDNLPYFVPNNPFSES